MSSDQSAEWFFFSPPERWTVSEALARLATTHPERRASVAAELDRLARLAELVRESLPIAESWPAHRRRVVPSQGLVDLLCRVPEYDFDLHIPNKALLGQSFLVVKVNFFKTIDNALADVAGAEHVRQRAEEEVGRAIYLKMVEELFISILTERYGDRKNKARAADYLFRIWENRLTAAADEFVPMLEAAWEARTKVTPVYGTMLGTAEVLSLFRQSKDDRFLDFFGRDDVDDEQLQAFEEFIFGLSYEHIQALRSRTVEKKSGIVSEDDAIEVLSDTSGLWVFEGFGAAGQYSSYKRRQVKARYRVLTRAPGPKRAAEEYVVIALMQLSAR